jgi:hypothetical protein
MHPLPNNPHDFALWLLEQLEDLDHADNICEGKLPANWNFQDVVRQLDGVGGGLAGVSSEATRTIEFHPASAMVYKSLDELFAHPANLRSVPARFTVLDLHYTHGNAASVPEQIANYQAAAQLCQLLPKVADHPANNGMAQHFIKSHDSKLEVKLEYGTSDLVPLPSLPLFKSEYVDDIHHQDQKRNIIRTTLIEQFKGKPSISISNLLPCFETFMENLRSSYAMYTVDFSFEKIRTEVEKQNLEDTLRLNKTVSDIQNQLLALPAALVLAGAGIQKGESLKNLTIWIGVCIFAWMMRTLLKNQGHSISAIQQEIDFRQLNLAGKPEGVSERFSEAFRVLKERAKTQERVMLGMTRAVGVMWLVVTALTIFVLWC